MNNRNLSRRSRTLTHYANSSNVRVANGVTLFVVRHGQTDGNLFDKSDGVTDTPLNNTGREQARAIAQTLRNIKFDAVYCSPLSRARETCEIILKGNALGGNSILDDRIQERNLGVWEGTSYAGLSVEQAFGGTWNLYNEVRVEGMETISEIFGRVHGFLDEVKIKHKGKNILIVCHAQIMRAIYFYFNAKPADGNLFRAYRAGNASIDKYNL